jgi:hypothetical protein
MAMRVSGWGFGLSIVLAGLAAVGCGNSSSSGPGGAGGNASVAGSSSTAGSSSGGAASTAGSSNAGSAGSSAGSGSGGLSGLNLGNSQTEACMAYVLAVCGRQAQCHGSSSSHCLSVTLGCPDLTSSPGSTRTVEGLQACAKTYSTLPCEQVDADELPACVTPGTLPLGNACAFNSQCQSLSCGGEESCGFCVPSAREGEPCSSTTGICLGNLACEGGKCTKLPGTTPGGDLKDVGGTCASHTDCKPELHCYNGSTCAAYPTLGESCSVARTCHNDSYCELDGLTCKAHPALGQPCGVDGFTGQAAYCAGEARCSRTSKGVGTCVELPVVGQACLIDPETQLPEYLSCSLTARCDVTQGPPRCAALASKGQACDATRDCATGLNCLCPDGTSTCSSHMCGELRFRDQACGATGEICHPGFSCTAGKCQPRDSQGLFAASCPNAP